MCDDNSPFPHTALLRRVFPAPLFVFFHGPKAESVCVCVITVYAVCSGPTGTHFKQKSVILFHFWKRQQLKYVVWKPSLSLFVVETYQVDLARVLTQQPHSQVSDPNVGQSILILYPTTSKAPLHVSFSPSPNWELDVDCWQIPFQNAWRWRLNISYFKADWRQEWLSLRLWISAASCFLVVPRRLPVLYMKLTSMCNQISDCFARL